MTLNVLQLGRRIHERRRAQGLTQEQLGVELGVSAQAVSKWENGESAPDIALLPNLCHTLGMSADHLLAILGGPGVEQLAQELRGRLKQMQPAERERALFAVVKLLLGTGEPDDASRLTQGNAVTCLFEQGGLAGLRLILKTGFAGLVMVENLVTSPHASSEQLDIIRTLATPECLEVARSLLGGQRRESELAGADLNLSLEELRIVLTRLTEVGLVTQGRTGYRLEDGISYAWVSIILAMATYAPPTRALHLEVNGRD